ncbi:hypothetical protein D9V32_13915 [Mycetocola tolaasinivorans]|uniref:Uncharacterized protein n=1 Tax=Mycetocola tolaasinivorans TaxID=76635 RepID=A0A3L7A234_9MICO|nr:hypothetical protein [Mycetocola tolaasinivorans]RLP74134.1 hypothetical protein D9V32_13915 [Mycetocola tolaasinivorans]
MRELQRPRLSRGSILALGVTATLLGSLFVSTPGAAYAAPAGAVSVSSAKKLATLSGSNPTISGSLASGSTLTANTGTWAAKPTFTYQWKRAGKNIAGATKRTYVSTTADRGKALTVTVTASKPGYTKAVRTSAARTVNNVLTKTPNPTISGSAKIGQTLTANPGTWAPSGVSLKYQWKRGGTAISGATGKTYRVTSADGGKTLTVTVTGSRAGYTSVSRTSSATAKVPSAQTGIGADATYRVGADIKAGTYITTGNPEFCYWARLSGYSGKVSDIIANHISTGQSIVTISATDTAFKSQSCGSWIRISDSKLTTLSTIQKNGTYVVGTQVKPGLYQSSSDPSKGCYWARLSGFGGSIYEIIDNDFSYTNRAFVRVEAGDKGFVTSGCGSWKRVGN